LKSLITPVIFTTPVGKVAVEEVAADLVNIVKVPVPSL
jgi:hypothetical protein